MSGISLNKHLAVTDIDFAILPTRARISVLYDGEPGGEGFIGFKRL